MKCAQKICEGSPARSAFRAAGIENDESAEECAVRETSEELNIRPEDIKIIAQMDFMHTYSNFTLYSLLGVIDYNVVKDLTVNPDEVKEIFLVPVSFLAENEPEIYCFDVLPNIGPDFPYEKIHLPNGYNWRKGRSTVPIYRYDDRVIWGLTARITQPFDGSGDRKNIRAYRPFFYFWQNLRGSIAAGIPPIL